MYSWIKYYIRQYFGFSRQETNGVVVLLFCITVSLVLPQLLRYYNIGHRKTAHTQDEATLDTLLAALDEQNKPTHQTPTAVQHTPLPPYFDINTATENQLQQLHGIGPKRARHIINYRQKLGRFESTAQYEQIPHLPTKVVKTLQKHTFASSQEVAQQSST